MQLHYMKIFDFYLNIFT